MNDNLNEEIKKCEEAIERARTSIDVYTNKLESLKSRKQPTMEEFYENMSSYITVKSAFRKYMFETGGDGRSQPPEEERHGKVCRVEIDKAIYLNQRQLDLIKQYVNDVHSPDHIELLV